jgi:type IV pilus assembly protein PilA
MNQPSDGGARLRTLREALGRTGRGEGDRPDEGFTLIELMVVLLIMAILLAIAIPTFLGVTSGAKVTAAQSNLTNAVISARTLYYKTGSWPGTTTPLTVALHKIDPSLGFTQSKPQKGSNSVSFQDFSTGNVIVFTARDSNTGCWLVATNESNSTLGPTSKIAPGEYYGWIKSASTNTTCTATKATPKVGKYTGAHNSTTWQPNFKTLGKTST